MESQLEHVEIALIAQSWETAYSYIPGQTPCGNLQVAIQGDEDIGAIRSIT